MKNVYQDAINKWGVAAQTDQAIEELSELITELLHYRRGKCPAEQVIDEIADVKIILEQLEYIFGSEKIKERMLAKLALLQKLINSD